MQTLLHFLYAAHLFFSPQYVPAGFTKVASGTPVTVAHHTYYPQTTCSITGITSCALPSFVIGTTGNAGWVSFGYCSDISCGVTTPGTVTVSGCGGTWTEVTSAASVQAAWTQRTFLAPNLAASAGCTVTIADSAGLLFYVQSELVDAAGANTTSPVDSSVSANATGSSTAPSVTSAGNVSSSGELGLVYVTCLAKGNSNTGTYTTLDNNTTDGETALSKALTSGPGTTAAITCTSGSWFASMVALKP